MGDARNNPDQQESNKRLRESLSALADGEANELEVHRVLDQLGDNDDLRTAALNYQRIGAAIRKESNAFANIDLSASIREALADEPEQETAEAPATNDAPRQGWVANLGRFAIAASVAFATIVGVETWQLAGNNGMEAGSQLASVPEPMPQPGAMASNTFFGGRSIQAGLGTEQSSMTPEQFNRARIYADQAAQARFRTYMLEHAEQASAYGGNMMPFVRAASFEATNR